MAKQFGVCCNGPRISRSNLRKLILIGTQSNTQRTSMDKILVHFYAKMVSTPTAKPLKINTTWKCVATQLA